MATTRAAAPAIFLDYIFRKGIPNLFQTIWFIYIDNK